MRRAIRPEVGALVAILTIAFVLRLAYILGQRGDILFDYPIVDEESYVAMARRLADGHGAAQPLWFHPPGLTYALAAIFAVAGKGLLAPRIVQAAVSTASCGLAFVVARRLFASVPVALATAGVMALHGMLVFESYELLPPTWMLATSLLAVGALLEARGRRTRRWSFGAGLALGVATVFGPTSLPFALVAFAVLRKPALVGAFVLGLALPIAPVTWGNWQRGHELVLVLTNGPINLYLGNNENYDQTLAIRPGPHWEALEAHPRSWFLEQVAAFWKAHPGQALDLYARKLYLCFDGPEIARDSDVYAMRPTSPLLSALVVPGPPWLPDGLLVPLALVGAAALWPDRRKLAVLYGFAGTQFVVVAAFFVTARYRVPSLPVLAMLACAGVASLARKTPRERALAAGGFVVLAVGLNLPTREGSTSFRGELEFYRAMELKTYRHDMDSALVHLRHATEQEPRDARFWFELGNALDATGARREAVATWERSSEVDPWDARGRRRAGFVLAQHGDLDAAVAQYRANVESRAREDAYYATDHLSLALLYARQGRDDEAIAELQKARAADASWYAAHIDGFAQTIASIPQIDAGFREALASRGAPAAGGSP